jgi:PH (Pleckstrin Homology) domain-containing protein
LVWRFPAYQPALAFVIATVCAAVNLYGHPPVSLRLLTSVLGVGALGVAIALLRMAFVVDSDGLAVRFLLRARWVPWAQVKDIGRADVRGSETLRIVRLDDTFEDVPPSLLQSVRPMAKNRASARLNGIVLRVQSQRPGPRP